MDTYNYRYSPPQAETCSVILKIEGPQLALSNKQKRYFTFFAVFLALFGVIYILTREKTGLQILNAQKAYNRGSYNEAVQILGPIINNMKSQNLKIDSSAVFLYAKSLRKLKNYRDAADHFQLIAESKKYDHAFHDEYGLALFGLNELASAKSRLLEAISINNKKPEYYNHLAMICIKSRTAWYEAARHLDQAIKITPDYVPAHINHGWLCYLKGEYTSAVWWFTEALKIEPHNRLACLNLSKTYKAMGNTTLSMQWLAKARSVARGL
jgi:tetratricopeptide (TPR) repeat protein